jgi:Flp pilus assembly pilin Flp
MSGSILLVRQRVQKGLRASLHDLARNESGQGTTEYAILVGVLVVIAILSIVTFRGKVQELWNAIADGLGQL